MVSSSSKSSNSSSNSGGAVRIPGVGWKTGPGPVPGGARTPSGARAGGAVAQRREEVAVSPAEVEEAKTPEQARQEQAEREQKAKRFDVLATTRRIGGKLVTRSQLIPTGRLPAPGVVEREPGRVVEVQKRDGRITEREIRRPEGGGIVISEEEREEGPEEDRLDPRGVIDDSEIQKDTTTRSVLRDVTAPVERAVGFMGEKSERASKMSAGELVMAVPMFLGKTVPENIYQRAEEYEQAVEETQTGLGTPLAKRRKAEEGIIEERAAKELIDYEKRRKEAEQRYYRDVLSLGAVSYPEAFPGITPAKVPEEQIEPTAEKMYQRYYAAVTGAATITEKRLEKIPEEVLLEQPTRRFQPGEKIPVEKIGVLGAEQLGVGPLSIPAFVAKVATKPIETGKQFAKGAIYDPAVFLVALLIGKGAAKGAAKGVGVARGIRAYRSYLKESKQLERATLTLRTSVTSVGRDIRIVSPKGKVITADIVKTATTAQIKIGERVRNYYQKAETAIEVGYPTERFGLARGTIKFDIGEIKKTPEPIVTTTIKAGKAKAVAPELSRALIPLERLYTRAGEARFTGLIKTSEAGMETAILTRGALARLPKDPLQLTTIYPKTKLQGVSQRFRARIQKLRRTKYPEIREDILTEQFLKGLERPKEVPGVQPRFLDIETLGARITKEFFAEKKPIVYAETTVRARTAAAKERKAFLDDLNKVYVKYQKELVGSRERKAARTKTEIDIAKFLEKPKMLPAPKDIFTIARARYAQYWQFRKGRRGVTKAPDVISIADLYRAGIRERVYPKPRGKPITREAAIARATGTSKQMSFDIAKNIIKMQKRVARAEGVKPIVTRPRGKPITPPVRELRVTTREGRVVRIPHTIEKAMKPFPKQQIRKAMGIEGAKQVAPQVTVQRAKPITRQKSRPKLETEELARRVSEAQARENVMQLESQKLSQAYGAKTRQLGKQTLGMGLATSLILAVRQRELTGLRSLARQQPRMINKVKLSQRQAQRLIPAQQQKVAQAMKTPAVPILERPLPPPITPTPTPRVAPIPRGLPFGIPPFLPGGGDRNQLKKMGRLLKREYGYTPTIVGREFEKPITLKQARKLAGKFFAGIERRAGIQVRKLKLPI